MTSPFAFGFMYFVYFALLHFVSVCTFPLQTQSLCMCMLRADVRLAPVHTGASANISFWNNKQDHVLVQLHCALPSSTMRYEEQYYTGAVSIYRRSRI